MDSSKDIADILIYFIPALLVLGAMYLVVKRYLDRDYKLRLLEARQSAQKELLPLRLQAYERLVLFLERISPSSLLMRTNQPNMNARQLQTELLAAVRSEFDHNLSQQIYISNTAWEQVKIAKEDMMKLINTASEQVNVNDTAINLSAQIFETMLRNEAMPTQRAIDFLKNEVRQLTLQQ